jgi:hypothetical protein
MKRVRSERRKRKSQKYDYHVALSFAGEDRKYVEQVASCLAQQGVKVFYDKFEEATLWGKNLYTHLRNVYEKKALFTVMFVSKAYKENVWPNHERESAQARAFESNREYILPAFFDKSVRVPGMLKTTGWISLLDRTPEELAKLIIEKLCGTGVDLEPTFSYSDNARADVDFPRHDNSALTNIMEGMKSNTWPKQAPAVRSIFALDWSTLDKNQIFVLGRNIYQCACGSERTAFGIVIDLREKLAGVPPSVGAHLLNGMLFEAYFDKEGKFRGHKLKDQHLKRLLEVQGVKRFEPSVAFIRHELAPYKRHLPFLPASPPETVVFDLVLSKSHLATIKSVRLRGSELLVKEDEKEVFPDRMTIALPKFTIEQLKRQLREKWNIPIDQIEFKSSNSIDLQAEYRFPENCVISWPAEGLRQ